MISTSNKYSLKDSVQIIHEDDSFRGRVGTVEGIYPSIRQNTYIYCVEFTAPRREPQIVKVYEKDIFPMIPARRREGKEIGIKDIRVGDEIEVHYNVADVKYVRTGVVGSIDASVPGVTQVHSKNGHRLANNGSPHIVLLKKAPEHTLDTAKNGDYFYGSVAVVYGKQRYTKHENSWIRDLFRPDGTLVKTEIASHGEAKRAFNNSETKLVSE